CDWTTIHHHIGDSMKRPWLAIDWFMIWGLFQTFAVAVLNGSWKRPSLHRGALQRPGIPRRRLHTLYFMTALLGFKGHWFGPLLGLFCGGAVVYVMIYLLALAKFRGPT